MIKDYNLQKFIAITLRIKESRCSGTLKKICFFVIVLFLLYFRSFHICKVCLCCKHFSKWEEGILRYRTITQKTQKHKKQRLHAHETGDAVHSFWFEKGMNGPFFNFQSCFHWFNHPWKSAPCARHCKYLLIVNTVKNCKYFVNTV